ncbi:MAG: hypothetical protein HYT93_03260 [Parcubacteria group bacterium]|nr:hypothetical protein [Parcubacteria group bacterium]
MAEFKTSFIPKKPISPSGAGQAQKGINLVLFVSIVIFFASALIAGGVFLFGVFLDRQEQGLTSSIERAREAIEPELVSSLSRIDARIKAVKNILDNHRTVSPLFDLLEQITLQSVSFESFQYIVESEGKINLLLSGTARNYSSIALQSVLFGEDRSIENPIFSNLQLNNQGNVKFNFSANVNQRLTLYRNAVLGAVTQSF